MYNNGSGSKRFKLSVDQICSNVASAVACSANERGITMSPQSIITSSITLPPVSQSYSALPASSTYEALNLSITSSPSPSSTSSSADQANSAAAYRKHSWPILEGSSSRHSSMVNAETSRALASAAFEGTRSAEESGKERRRRQKLANKDNLFCQVCGDKANGYNFGAITCESCKAFFRRNALKNKDLRCNFDNSCKIDHFTRKFCTACRLNKCFNVNMKKEWILDEDALKKRKKLTRRIVREDSNSGEYDAPTFPTLTTSQTFGASSAPNPNIPGLYMYIDPVASTPIDTNTLSDDADYPPLPLSDEDAAEIARIMTSHAQISTNSVDSPVLSPASQVLDYADGYIRKIIKFVRSLSEYRDLAQSDQIVLLKSGIMETLVMRSAIMYNPSVDATDSNQGMAAPASKGRDGGNNEESSDLFADHRKLVRSINATVKWDKSTLVLALIINLFSAERAPVIHVAHVKRAEERYSLLLQAYLRSKHSHYEARGIFHQLFQKLSDVKSYCETCAKHIARVTASELEPLMREIFSMT